MTKNTKKTKSTGTSKKSSTSKRSGSKNTKKASTSKQGGKKTTRQSRKRAPEKVTITGRISTTVLSEGETVEVALTEDVQRMIGAGFVKVEN